MPVQVTTYARCDLHGNPMNSEFSGIEWRTVLSRILNHDAFRSQMRSTPAVVPYNLIDGFDSSQTPTLVARNSHSQTRSSWRIQGEGLGQAGRRNRSDQSLSRRRQFPLTVPSRAPPPHFPLSSYLYPATNRVIALCSHRGRKVRTAQGNAPAKHRGARSVSTDTRTRSQKVPQKITAPSHRPATGRAG